MAQYFMQLLDIYNVVMCVRVYIESFSHLGPCLLICEKQSFVTFVHFKNPKDNHIVGFYRASEGLRGVCRQKFEGATHLTEYKILCFSLT